MTKCKAIVENPLQRENLCQCCNIIGVVPRIDGESVVAETNDELLSDKLVEVFEQYTRHTIMMSDDKGFRLNCN